MSHKKAPAKDKIVSRRLFKYPSICGQGLFITVLLTRSERGERKGTMRYVAPFVQQLHHHAHVPDDRVTLSLSRLHLLFKGHVTQDSGNRYSFHQEVTGLRLMNELLEQLSISRPMPCPSSAISVTAASVHPLSHKKHCSSHPPQPLEAPRPTYDCFLIASPCKLGTYVFLTLSSLTHPVTITFPIHKQYRCRSKDQTRGSEIN